MHRKAAERREFNEGARATTRCRQSTASAQELFMPFLAATLTIAEDTQWADGKCAA